MSIRKTIPLLFLIFAATALFAQTAEEKERIKRQRLKTIDLYHLSVGMDSHFNQNAFFSPKLSVGMGSFRNRINADIGVRYTIGGSVFFDYEESILLHQLPIFVSAQFITFPSPRRIIYCRQPQSSPTTKSAMPMAAEESRQE